MKQIVAIGDGGLNPDNPFMDLYILAQTKKKNPKVCLIPTASGDNGSYINFYKKIYSRYPCETSCLSLFSPSVKDLKDFIMSRDVIFVSGGHTKNMLAIWRDWGLDTILRSAYDNGTVLSGGSAGSVCWFDQCITDSIPGSLTVMNCLGILPYSNCPHFSSKSRRASYAHFVSTNQIKPGYAADDFSALHFVDGVLHRSVSIKPYAQTFEVSMNEGKLTQKRHKTKWLDLEKYHGEFIYGSPTFSDSIY